MLQYFLQYLKLPYLERKLIRQAFWYSFFARLLTLFFPLKYYKFILGNQHIDSPFITINTSIINTIKQSIYKISRHTPWRCKCYEQAITGKLLLKKYKLQSTLYLGVKKENSSLKAHAWLRCGTTIITGETGKENFTIVAIFT